MYAAIGGIGLTSQELETIQEEREHLIVKSKPMITIKTALIENCG
jgi:hypothetical protein